MQRRSAIAILIVGTVVLLGVPTSRAFAQLSATVTVGPDGQIEITGPQEAPEPEPCTGPGTVLSGTLTVFNHSDSPGDAAVTLSLDPGLLAESCISDLGTCTIPDQSHIHWTVTVPPHGTASIDVRVLIALGTPADTSLCIHVSFSFNQGNPTAFDVCTTTNSAAQCGVSAPLVGIVGRSALLAALGVLGMGLLRRRGA